MEIPEENKKKLFKATFVLLIILCVYFGVKIFGDIRHSGMRGEKSTPSTISFSGHGEVNAVPDIANVYFTISKDARTAKDAQAAVAVIEKKALDFLKSKNVGEKDIKTSNASVYPKYEGSCLGVAGSLGTWNCNNYKQMLVGYTASESITVKIRNVDDSGSIMQGLGGLGVTDLNGPNFAIDNEDSLKAQARKKAIDDAKEKAKVLAKDLGVRLGKISSFTESGNYYPIMYGKAAMFDSAVSSAPAPAEIPKGENTISSDVTITYEIR